MDYSKFNNAVNMDELKAGIEDARLKSMGVPVKADYDVTIKSMELTESKKNQPMVKIVFVVVDGFYANSEIEMYQVITNGFQIHILNEFLRSLESDVEVEFEDYQQYGEMIEQIFKKVKGNFEYKLYYGENSSGYKTYKIKDIYELD